MKSSYRPVLWGLFAALFVVGTSEHPVHAQSSPPSVYYSKFVNNTDGSRNERVPPDVTFTVYLNRDTSRVLTENAPQWEERDPNIAGNGRFGVQLGNFPTFNEGDSVYVRFTDTVAGEQGHLVDHIDTIPWTDDNPFQALQLQSVTLPDRPQNVSLGETDAGTPVVEWTALPGLTYMVYRRAKGDVLFNGKSRRLYSRVAQGLTEGQYIDETASPDSSYGYIVYAVSSDGVVSAHSEDVKEVDRIENLAASPTATTVALTWKAFSTPVGETAGYNIYRRRAGESYGVPIGYTGIQDTLGGTRYVDTQLQTGTTYYYQVRARNQQYAVDGLSQEVHVTTESSTEDYYPYANLKAAVVIYPNTNGEISIPEDEIDDIKRGLETAREFYWRNTKMRLNLQFTYYIFDEYVDFGESNSWTSTELTMQHLNDLGVTSTQYDLVFRITTYRHPEDGAIYYSWGTIPSGLPGPGREVGFSTILRNYGNGNKYPGYEFINNVDLGATWLFVHEAQHAIDDIYRVNGHSEMAHGDLPEQFPIRAGEHYDFQAKIFRTFDAYRGLGAAWGDVYEAPDTDADDFADNDVRVPLDEERFGTSTSTPDTDGDGLTDAQEMYAGTFSGSDAADPDTDGDGTSDGADAHPRYPVDTTIEEFTPVVDGVIEEGWPLVNDTVVFSAGAFSPKLYMSYGNDSLYVAIHTYKRAYPDLWFDFDADGFWHGRGNVQMRIAGTDVREERFTTFRSRDASAEAKEINNGHGLWDTSQEYIQHFRRRVMRPSVVNLQSSLDLPEIQIEMAIPRNEYANLELNPGDSLGMYVDYAVVIDGQSTSAFTFDKFSYVYFTLAGKTDSKRKQSLLPQAVRLLPNYPNPFASRTRIDYSLTRAGAVTLAVYDVLGRRVRTLVSARQAPGHYTVTWDGITVSGERAASGVYIYRLITPGGRQLIKKMTLTRR